MKKLLLLLLSPVVFMAQGGTPQFGPIITTVAGLAAYAINGNHAGVTDGNSATDCTVGGGSTFVLCGYNGSSWSAIGGSGGAGTVTSVGLAGTTNQISISGATPITTSGSWTLSIPTNPILPGTTTLAVRDTGGQVYNALANGLVADEKTTTGCSITTGTNSLTCSGGGFTSGDIGKTISVNKAGAAAFNQALDTTISGFTSATQVTLTANAGNTASSVVAAWGTDNTSALTTLDSTVNTAGGGVIYFPTGQYMFLGQITLPNDGAGPPSNMHSLAWVGAGMSSNGQWTTPPTAASVLDFRYNANANTQDAKILTVGNGTFRIQHLAIVDTSADINKYFIQTSYTQLLISDCLFRGTTANTTSVNGISLGNASTPVFQGYGTVIKDNFFSQITVAVLMGASANAVSILHNTVSKDCGGASAFQLVSSVGGAYIAGNLVEDTHYTDAFLVQPSTQATAQGSNVFVGNTCWDTGGSSYCYKFNSSNNTLIASHSDEMNSSPQKLIDPTGKFPQGSYPGITMFGINNPANTATQALSALNGGDAMFTIAAGNALSTNITGWTITKLLPGAHLNFIFQQPASGGPFTVAAPSGAVGWTAVDGTASAYSTEFCIVDYNGTTLICNAGH